MKKVNNVSVGNAGEYFVAGELERRGFSVAVPMSNVELFDILAIDRDNIENQFAIQVKTNHSNNAEWMLSEKNEKINEKNIFYVFVKLNDKDNPSYHIVPSAIVAERIKEDHKKWLQTPGKNGKPHNDNKMRKFKDVNNEYLDAWDLLK